MRTTGSVYNEDGDRFSDEKELLTHELINRLFHHDDETAPGVIKAFIEEYPAIKDYYTDEELYKF